MSFVNPLFPRASVLTIASAFGIESPGHQDAYLLTDIIDYVLNQSGNSPSGQVWQRAFARTTYQMGTSFGQGVNLFQGGMDGIFARAFKEISNKHPEEYQSFVSSLEPADSETSSDQRPSPPPEEEGDTITPNDGLFDSLEPASDRTLKPDQPLELSSEGFEFSASPGKVVRVDSPTAFTTEKFKPGERFSTQRRTATSFAKSNVEMFLEDKTSSSDDSISATLDAVRERMPTKEFGLAAGSRFGAPSYASLAPLNMVMATGKEKEWPSLPRGLLALAQGTMRIRSVPGVIPTKDDIIYSSSAVFGAVFVPQQVTLQSWHNSETLIPGISLAEATMPGTDQRVFDIKMGSSIISSVLPKQTGGWSSTGVRSTLNLREVSDDRKATVTVGTKVLTSAYSVILPGETVKVTTMAQAQQFAQQVRADEVVASTQAMGGSQARIAALEEQLLSYRDKLAQRDAYIQKADDQAALHKQLLQEEERKRKVAEGKAIALQAKSLDTVPMQDYLKIQAQVDTFRQNSIKLQDELTRLALKVTAMDVLSGDAEARRLQVARQVLAAADGKSDGTVALIIGNILSA